MELRIQYSNTVADLLAFQFSHAIRSPWYYLLFVVWSYVWLDPVTEGWSHWSCGTCTAKYFGIFAVIIVSSFLLLTIAPQGLRFLSKKHRASLAPRTITISEAGIVEETDNSKSEYKWSAIQRVIKTKRLVALYISPSLAHLVPRRAFDGNESWQNFNRIVEVHAQNA